LRKSGSPAQQDQDQDRHQSSPGRSSHSNSNPYDTFDLSSNSAMTSNELSEIPRDYLDQLTVLKHLAKEVQVSSLNCVSTYFHFRTG
jgi:hypothetical protein